MTLRQPPNAASWFLNQFGTNAENDSAIGDLTEQYQRGRGSIWYWRQVLAIVFMGLFREIQSDKRHFLAVLVRTWCVWGGLQFAAGMILMARYVWLHPEHLRNGISVYGFPILAIRPEMKAPYSEQLEIILLSLLLNALALLAVGAYCARSTKVNPRTMLLAFIVSYLVPYFGWTMAILVDVARGQPNGDAFLALRALIALPLVPALILFGGTKGVFPSRRQL